VKINGRQHYLWRAVDQDGEFVDVYLQAKWNGAAAKRFFRRQLMSLGSEPGKIVSDRLRSHGVAHRKLIPDTIHSTEQYENNRAEIAKIQIDAAGSKILGCSCRRQQSIQSGKALDQSLAL
jgi:putative transposase